MNRVFHDYRNLEEFHCGMWRIVRGEERKENAKAAAKLMQNIPQFIENMRRAVKEWPISCEHNLTAASVNRIAWLGHAGCLLGVGSPEENTRVGWHMLSLGEQAKANAAAEMVLQEWVRSYSGDSKC